jgi:hypothetical protein
MFHNDEPTSKKPYNESFKKIVDETFNKFTSNIDVEVASRSKFGNFGFVTTCTPSLYNFEVIGLMWFNDGFAFTYIDLNCLNHFNFLQLILMLLFCKFLHSLMSLDLENVDVFATLAFDFNDQYFCPNSPIVIVDYNVFVTIDCDFLISEVFSMFHFLDVNERKLKNTNKSGHKANKNVELWAMNAFDE